ncbi:MAG: hypothetical protein ABIX46_04305 [Burkholderiaceae bacterium]
MPPRHDPDPAGLPAGVAHLLRARALQILWPAFLMAGVLEALVFVVVDPLSLHGFGAGPLGWSASAVYSVAFLIFWGVIATSGALTALLDVPVA